MCVIKSQGSLNARSTRANRNAATADFNTNSNLSTHISNSSSSTSDERNAAAAATNQMLQNGNTAIAGANGVSPTSAAATSSSNVTSSPRRSTSTTSLIADKLREFNCVKCDSPNAPYTVVVATPLKTLSYCNSCYQSKYGTALADNSN
jgi:hypothetical protein